MASIRPFKGLRPKKELVEKVAELPYDVVNSEEAREIAKGNEFSFFHISKPEIDMDRNIDPYHDSVYELGKKNLNDFIKKGVMTQDQKSCLYLYTQVMNNRAQTGLVACVSADDYLQNIIKKHELTREDKENDRTRHLDILNANTGPVFLLYNEDGKKTAIFEKAMKISPEYDFIAKDGIRHILRVISDQDLVQSFILTFQQDVLYIADGHHRAASGVRVAVNRRKEFKNYSGDEEFNWFLAVIFPHTQLKIMPYNRVVKDLNGHRKDGFLEALSKMFTIDKNDIQEPRQLHTISMYLDKDWYTLTPKFAISDDPIESLDVSILQKNVLDKILDIKDPRKDKRIDFIGGIRGTTELVKLVDSGKFVVAFSMYPTTVDQLMRVSDSDSIMPPKSTWFEPKLRSGLVVHLL